MPGVDTHIARVVRIRSRGRGEVVDDSGHIGERSRLATGYCEYLGDESERSPVKRADEAREREDFRKLASLLRSNRTTSESWGLRGLIFCAG